jgi:sugar phosphate isomerase/epimerase
MRVGLCIGVQNFSEFKNSRLDYFEMNLNQLAVISNDEYVTALENLVSSPIKPETASCFCPRDIKLCGKDYDEARLVEYVEKAFKRAQGLGINLCVIGSGASRFVGEDENFDACIEQFISTLRLCGDIAEKYGITLVIEPLNHNETNVINTVEQAAQLCKRVAHPNVSILADTYHMSVENEPLDTIIKYANLIKHVHIAEPSERTYPICDDGYDYSKVVTVLKKADYTGRVTIEAIAKNDFVSEAMASIPYIKDVFK